LSATPRQPHLRAAFPGLDHHLLVGAQVDRLANRQHMVVGISLARDPGATRLDHQPTRAPGAQQPHAAGLQRTVAEQRVEDRVLQNRHGSLPSSPPCPEPEPVAAH
jgi:hypothetical protein